MNDLRTLALRYPEAEEGIACAGTALEKRTVKVRTKAFLFLSKTDAMLKLRESLPEATKLAAQGPTHCKVGAHGWITVTIGDDASPPFDLVSRWIDESYRLLATKELVASLPSSGPPPSAATPAAKKKSARKKADDR